MKNRILITNTETYVKAFINSPFPVGVFENDGSISTWRTYITSGIFDKGWSASGLFVKDYFHNNQEEGNAYLDN